MTGALADVRIVSFAQLAQGPLATQMLGELGAEVVKVEPPGGEWLRADPGLDADDIGLNSVLAGDNLSFLSLNRNKRSIELDLKDEAHRAVAYDLVETADVVIENFRPGVMDRLGFGYDDLVESNPGLIYCSSSGYGSAGPYVGRPAQDIIIQGLSGLMALTGSAADPPTPVGTTVVDTYTAMQIITGVLAALHHRDRTGDGQRVEVDMLSAATHLLSQEVAVAANTGESPERSEVLGMGHPYLQAPYGVYETADGYIAVSLSTVAQVANLLGIAELDDVTTLREAYRRRDEIKSRIGDALRTEPTNYWLDEFTGHDLWCGPVRELESLLDDPQIESNELIETIKHVDDESLTVVGTPFEMSETNPRIGSRPPLAGEHTADILAELGHPPDTLDG